MFYYRKKITVMKARIVVENKWDRCASTKNWLMCFVAFYLTSDNEILSCVTCMKLLTSIDF